MHRDNKDNSNVPHTRNEAVKQANGFLQYFNNKVEVVRAETDHAAPPKIEQGDNSLMENIITLCTDEIQKWMFSNSLKLSCDKTEVMWINYNYIREYFSFNVVNSGSQSW